MGNGHWGYHLTVRIRENLTIPNVLSVLRLARLPTFVSLFADGRVVAGSWFFGLLASTDWIDGYIARRFNQVSELGKILDPIADKVLTGGALIALSILGELPWWVTVVILIREVGDSPLIHVVNGCISTDSTYDIWISNYL